jgi:L-asparaginase II
MRGAAIVKIGAEGVFAGAVAKTGQGFALKIADGAGRAVETACAHLLDRLGLLDDAARATLAPWLRTPIANRAGAVVGEIRPAAWTAF